MSEWTIAILVYNEIMYDLDEVCVQVFSSKFQDHLGTSCSIVPKYCITFWLLLFARKKNIAHGTLQKETFLVFVA